MEVQCWLIPRAGIVRLLVGMCPWLLASLQAPCSLGCRQPRAEMIPVHHKHQERKSFICIFNTKTEMKVKVFSCIFYDVYLSQLLYLQWLRKLIFHIGTEEGDREGWVPCYALESSGYCSVSQWWWAEAASALGSAWPEFLLCGWCAGIWRFKTLCWRMGE